MISSTASAKLPTRIPRWHVIDIMKDRADSFKGSGRADGTDMTVSYVMRTATDSSSNSTSTTEETTTETETKDSFWNRVANLFSK